jgi:membrane protease YdiL (CAAX protease family)
MRYRSGALAGWLIGALAFLALFSLAGVAASTAPIGARLIALASAAGSGLGLWRATVCGLDVGSDRVIVRSFFWSRRIAADEVAGVAIEPVLRRRFARLDLVTTTGEVLPVVFAAWRMRTQVLQTNAMRAAASVGRVADGRSAAEAVPGRVEHPSAFTAMLSDGRMVALPALTRDPGLSPATVQRPGVPMLGRETIAMAVAFVLPATVAAVAIFARHVAGVANLDEFDLPLPDNLSASLALMVVLYLSTAVFTPMALLLLARTGQWPRALGLSGRGLLRDAFPAVGLLIGTWASTFVLALPLTGILNNDSLTNQQHNTHVPAYFIVYAIVVSATTAINEEVIVNGYVMTRMAQLGWRPWPALALSLALRTSYHAYYGIGLIATVPFGYWATRSFQKHQRLGRPIIAHFLNDAVILTAAVLTS